jgi:uncharacterized membrane protein
MSDGAAVAMSSEAGSESATTPRRKRNKAAIFSFVLSLFGALTFPILFAVPSIVGIILGAVGLRRIRRSEGGQRGIALAVTGILVGLLSVAFVIALVHASPCYLHPNSPACTDKYPG